MTTTLHFDGSTATLGLDGWFQLSHVQVDTYPQDGECVVSLYDRSTSTALRVMLHVYNPEELRTLIDGLTAALFQITTNKETTT